jgi:hypothetical protein
MIPKKPIATPNLDDEELTRAEHYRDRARSSGALSRNGSGRPINSFGTLRRFARSFKTFSMPLSRHIGRRFKNARVSFKRFGHNVGILFPRPFDDGFFREALISLDQMNRRNIRAEEISTS